MNREEATNFIKTVILPKLGGGYHPDTFLSDYINIETKQPTFTEEEVEQLRPLHNEACDILGDEVYTIALNELELKS